MNAWSLALGNLCRMPPAPVVIQPQKPKPVIRKKKVAKTCPHCGQPVLNAEITGRTLAQNEAEDA